MTLISPKRSLFMVGQSKLKMRAGRGKQECWGWEREHPPGRQVLLLFARHFPTPISKGTPGWNLYLAFKLRQLGSFWGRQEALSKGDNNSTGTNSSPLIPIQCLELAALLRLWRPCMAKRRGSRLWHGMEHWQGASLLAQLLHLDRTFVCT